MSPSPSPAPDSIPLGLAKRQEEKQLIPGRTFPLGGVLACPVLSSAGPAALFAAEEFFYGRLRNHHTRTAYARSIQRFLVWANVRNLELARITPGDIGRYLDELRTVPLSIATRKQHLSALRHFFDALVTRHAVVLNPALSVRGERYQALEGKRPEISIAGARSLLASLQADTSVVALRDRAIIAILIYTAARAGAVAALKQKSFYYAGDQWMLQLEEKGGKLRQIPVRHDLQRILHHYQQEAGLSNVSKEAPLFCTAYRRSNRFTANGIRAIDICRMVKRKLKAIGLPESLSPHSFRVTTLTDLLEQGVPLEDVQNLAGHADPRTTRLYDRRQRTIVRNIVERISI
jgi:integrase/recombinase XerD